MGHISHGDRGGTACRVRGLGCGTGQDGPAGCARLPGGVAPQALAREAKCGQNPRLYVLALLSTPPHSSFPSEQKLQVWLRLLQLLAHGEGVRARRFRACLDLEHSRWSRVMLTLRGPLGRSGWDCRAHSQVRVVSSKHCGHAVSSLRFPYCVFSLAHRVRHATQHQAPQTCRPPARVTRRQAQPGESCWIGATYFHAIFSCCNLRILSILFA